MAESTEPGVKIKVVLGAKDEDWQQAVVKTDQQDNHSSSSSVEPGKELVENSEALMNSPVQDLMLNDPNNTRPCLNTGEHDKTTDMVQKCSEEHITAITSSGGDGLTLKDENPVEDAVPENGENSEPSSSNGIAFSVLTLHDTKSGASMQDSDCLEITSSQESMRATSSGENLLSPSDEEKLMHDIENLTVEPTDSLTLLAVSDTDIHAGSGYELKRILWHKRIIPIVTQNQNGPCPLIAIANVLLLREKIVIPAILKVVTAEQLMEYVADCIIENIPKNLSGMAQLNYEQNMHDAIGVLPRLITGLDVNVRFTGVRDFEYTPECIIFDLLNIPLYHGWLVDPQAKEMMNAIGNLGYNQLVEKIIVNKFSEDSDAVTQALTAELFLENSATQLTYHGLCELNSAMISNELAILFRNNHFSTIHKKGNELFQLVTDQGFLNEPRVVWEALCNIEGDSLFVDANFYDSPPKNSDHTLVPGSSFVPLPKTVSTAQQINQDFLVALSLQEDHATTDQKTNESQSWEGFEDVGSNSQVSSIDLELARRLQQNYQRDVDLRSESSRSPSSSQLRSPDRNKKGSGCTLL